jgi:hypothetical protein
VFTAVGQEVNRWRIWLGGMPHDGNKGMNRSFYSRTSRFRKTDGLTLVETTIGMALAALFLTALMVARVNMMGLLQRAKENASASQLVQQRVEEMRIANWLQITDAAFVSGTLMNKASESAVGLTAPVETLTVAEYPANAGQVPVKVKRSASGTQIVSQNASLKDCRMVRVDFDLTWTGIPGQRARARSSSVLIAKGGISK